MQRDEFHPPKRGERSPPPPSSPSPPDRAERCLPELVTNVRLNSRGTVQVPVGLCQEAKLVLTSCRRRRHDQYPALEHRERLVVDAHDPGVQPLGDLQAALHRARRAMG